MLNLVFGRLTSESPPPLDTPVIVSLDAWDSHLLGASRGSSSGTAAPALAALQCEPLDTDAAAAPGERQLITSDG